MKKPMELFERYKKNILLSASLDRDNTRSARLEGELMGAYFACSYLDGADQSALFRALYDAQFELREVMAAKGSRD